MTITVPLTINGEAHLNGRVIPKEEMLKAVDAWKEFLDALVDGKDLNTAIDKAKDGMKSGGLNALIDTGSGFLGDIPTGGASTKLFEKIAGGSSKLVEGTMSSDAVRSGFQTFVADVIKDQAAAE